MKTMTLKTRLLISLLTVLMTSLLFYIGIFMIHKVDFNSNAVLTHVITGLILGTYLFVILHYKLLVAVLFFVFGYFASFIVLFYNLSISANDGFSGVAAIFMWLMMIIVLPVVGLLLEIIQRLLNKEKQTDSH